MLRPVFPAATLLAAASAASAADYVRVLDFPTINAGGSSTTLYATVPTDNGFYSFVTGSNAPRVTYTTAGSSGWTSIQVMSTPQWTSFGGSNTGFVPYGAGISGNFLQVVDTSGSEAIWRIDLSTGAATQYATNAAITAYIQDATGDDTLEANLTTSHTVAPNGQHVVFESDSDSMLRTTGSGTVETLFTAAELTAATGGTGIRGGITFDGSGRLIFGSDNSDSLWAFDESDSTFTELFDGDALMAITGESTARFNDVFYAPDGRVYFQDNGSDHILGFDLDDPSTLSIVVSLAELDAASGVGSGFVGQLSWYNGNLAWNTAGTAGGTNQGFYAIPEPASLALLALAGAMTLRRRVG